jgi:hypothetical protein
MARPSRKMRRGLGGTAADRAIAGRDSLSDNMDSVGEFRLPTNPVCPISENDQRQLESRANHPNSAVLSRYSSVSRESGGIRRNEGTCQEIDSRQTTGRITIVPFLHLGVRFEGSKAPDTDAIESVLNKAKDWYRYTSNCWIIYTKLDASTWTDRLKKIPGMENHAQFFVSELNLDNRSGWASQDLWDWLDKSRI